MFSRPCFEALAKPTRCAITKIFFMMSTLARSEHDSVCNPRDPREGSISPAHRAPRSPQRRFIKRGPGWQMKKKGTSDDGKSRENNTSCRRRFIWVNHGEIRGSHECVCVS